MADSFALLVGQAGGLAGCAAAGVRLYSQSRVRPPGFKPPGSGESPTGALAGGSRRASGAPGPDARRR
ncbi:MAG: hypothetical protein KGJ25_06100, partial [Betaproteobacteria bacterium]|nr:hypothetical protein [Betaproteobacteria bacterium]